LELKVKTLQYIEALFSTISAKNYCLPDWEASLLLPYLVAAVDNSKELTLLTRSSFRLLCKIHPASKVFRLLFDGLRNAKVCC
jgi:hypothetical protein